MTMVNPNRKQLYYLIATVSFGIQKQTENFQVSTNPIFNLINDDSNYLCNRKERLQKIICIIDYRKGRYLLSTVKVKPLQPH